MSSTIYRKYRPKTFGEVIGQNHIKITIENELASGQIAHAYLFSGPRGLGKTTMARLLAKAVNCLNRKPGESEPCNLCPSCVEMNENKSLDVVEIDAASHTGVDNVRENIINNSRFTPTSRKYKVFIIDEVHMLSISAFNALLKTLEEPPSYAIFILATTEIHKVPQTIISRCQRFDFRKVSRTDLIGRLNHIIALENKKVDETILENIAQYSEGCIRDAESLLGQILSLDEKEITRQQAELVIPSSRLDLVLELIKLLINCQTASAITLINRLVQEGIDLPRFAGDLIEILRKLLLVKVGADPQDFGADFNRKIDSEVLALTQQISLEKLIAAIDIFITAKQELKSAEISQLPLELAVVKICELDSPNDKTDNKPTDGSTASQTKKFYSPKPEVKPSLKTESQPVIKKSAVKADVEQSKPADLPAAEAKPALTRIDLTIEQIKEKWGEVLTRVKEHNHSLASTLQLHHPGALESDGVVEIYFKYKFHQQRVKDTKNLRILEEVLSQIFSTPLRVKTILTESLLDDKLEISSLAESNSDEPAEGVEGILKNFGGQLVE